MFSGAFKIEIRREREREREREVNPVLMKPKIRWSSSSRLPKKPKESPNQRSPHTNQDLFGVGLQKIKFLGYGYNCHDLRLL
jgi:hypothetical protein